ncbi:hypothetical protein K3740_05900 [Ruegeria conchae]|uniref:hypothetical protein n=1 Tax=Ruegeria conchae TaxID=981384 RepID=UPI00147CB9BA|nr:hypothetical protein [Ruegeria conchae]UWR04222.1 hypothetical protein K3740_05900 [Ruegeria conchae]
MSEKFGDLFRDEPEQWGLRGDPFLWREIREKLAAVDLPSDISKAHRLLENTFWEATGQSLAFCDDFYVERFAHGGMSSGWICGKFWRERGVPKIIERLRAELEQSRSSNE